MKRLFGIGLLGALLCLAASPPAFSISPVGDEASLRQADAAQLAAARNRDADALDRIMDSHFVVNSPEGEIWSREKTIALWRNRGIGHDRFDRVVESVTMEGDVGVVAGREVVEPSADSIAGKRRADGGKAVLRRFTNVWLWRDGRWWFFARHANEQSGPVRP